MCETAMRFFKSKLIKSIFFIGMSFFSTSSRAENLDLLDTQPYGPVVLESESTENVSVEQTVDVSLPYKQRRTKHGVLFGVSSEKYYPYDYFSQYRDVPIEEIIGTSRIPLIGAELGYKRNIALGSVSILAGYAAGSFTGSVNALDRKLEVSRFSLAAGFALDNLMNEPYIVPYIQGGLHNITITESTSDLSKDAKRTASSGLSYNYRLGLLFQLDWIEKSMDPTTHREGLLASGLENSFIDVFAADHTSTSGHYDSSPTSTGNPDLSSNLELGVGLKFEF